MPVGLQTLTSHSDQKGATITSFEMQVQLLFALGVFENNYCNHSGYLLYVRLNGREEGIVRGLFTAFVKTFFF